MSINLQRFNTSSINLYSRIVVVGNRDTGKTNLVSRDLIPSLAGPPIVYHPSDKIRAYINAGVDQDHILTEFKYQKCPIYTAHPDRTVVIDDCNMFDRRTRTQLIKLFRQHRQYKVNTILVTRDYDMLPNKMGYDYMFLSNMNSRDLYQLWSNHLSRIMSDYYRFKLAFREVTRNYGFMVADLKTKQLFWYKAAPPPPPRFKRLKLSDWLSHVERPFSKSRQ